MATWYWPSEHYGVWFKTPYSPGWLQELKDQVPYPERYWDRGNRLWWIGDDYADGVVHLTIRWFDSCVQGPPGFQEPPLPPGRPRGRTSKSKKNHHHRDAGFGVFVPASCPSDFRLLGLDPSAPPEVVKAAYKALCRLHHPDHGGRLEEMQRINMAYERLKDGLGL